MIPAPTWLIILIARIDWEPKHSGLMRLNEYWLIIAMWIYDKWYSLSFYAHMSLKQKQDNSCSKCYWAAYSKRKNIDLGKDFNDCSLIPITDTCRVLVLYPTEFTVFFLNVFQLTVRHTTGAHRIPSRIQRDTTYAVISTLCRQVVKITRRSASVASLICINLL